MEPRFVLFDHTADIGVRATAPTQPELIAPSIDGLYSVVGELRPCGPSEPCSFEFTGDDGALLLRDLLAELLHLLDSRRHMFVSPIVEEFSPHRLAVSGQACPIDEAASSLDREVKAVTYHGLSLSRLADSYEATYIVDI